MFKAKKLNNKGVTLVELIVSFALVSIAIIYFYQTLTTVTKMYTNAKKNTTNTADKNYVLRLLDEYLDSADTFIIDIESYGKVVGEDDDGTGEISDDAKELKVGYYLDPDSATTKSSFDDFVVFDDCFDGWYDAFKKIDDNGRIFNKTTVDRDLIDNDINLGYLKYPRSLNASNSVEFLDETYKTEKENYLINNTNTFTSTENPIYKNNTYNFDLNGGKDGKVRNPAIIQKILFYMNAFLPNEPSTMANTYNRRFTSWWCTYTTGNKPFSNCFKDISDSYYDNFYNSSIKKDTRYYLSFPANAETTSYTNAYDYENSCFNKINNENVWIPIRLQYQKINFDNFKNKFGINSVEVGENEYLKTLLYNPNKKLIRAKLEYNGVVLTYYKFYDHKEHKVSYYTSYLVENCTEEYIDGDKESCKKGQTNSRDFTMFLAHFD